MFENEIKWIQNIALVVGNKSVRDDKALAKLSVTFSLMLLQTLA